MTSAEDKFLAEAGYPTAAEMINLVNDDLLPFFEANFPSPDGHDPVVSLRGVVLEGHDFVFVREDGSLLAVWEEYFKDPEGWKAHRLRYRKV